MGLGASTCKFKQDDLVKVHVDVDELKLMQKGHGGWEPRMEDFIGKVGSVHAVYPSGDVVVEYGSNSEILTYNPDALIKVPLFVMGDSVNIMEDIQLQTTL